MKKYEFTGETKTWCGHVLRQIRVVVTFANVDKGEIGGWIETEGNLSHDGDAWVCGDAKVSSDSDYVVFKNCWSSYRWFTYTRSNKMWKVGCFHGTGKELVAKAYRDSKRSGKCYEAIVKAMEAIEEAMP